MRICIKNEFLANNRIPEIFVNISKEMNKIFNKYNDSMVPFDKFVDNYILLKYNGNFYIH